MSNSTKEKSLDKSKEGGVKKARLIPEGVIDSVLLSAKDTKIGVKKGEKNTFSLNKRIATGISLVLEARDEFMESSADSRVKKLRMCIDGISKLKGKDVDIVTGCLYDSLNQSEGPVYFDEENYEDLMKVLIEDYYNMTKLSKRKIALFAVKKLFEKEFEELPELDKKRKNKNEFIKERVKQLQINLSKVTYGIISDLYDHYGLKLEIMRFYEAFVGEVGKDGLVDKMKEDYIGDRDVLSIGEEFPISGINIKQLRRYLLLEGRKETKFSSMLEGIDQNKEDSVAIKNIEHEKVEANGFINPNWFLYDIGVIDGIKLFGEDKTRYLFGKYFWSAIKNINKSCDLQSDLPDFYNLFCFRLKKESEDKNPDPSMKGPDQFVDMYQHIIEWDVPENWDEKGLEKLGVFMKEMITDLNLSIGAYQEFRHPVKTMDGRVVYRGYFSGVKDFENQHIVLLKNKDDGKTKLRFASECGQDMFMYFIIQISYFMKHGKFLDKNQLFSVIYRNYNLLTTENQEVFDISKFESQYEALIENIVWPLSTEYINKNNKPGKAKNSLLVGIYGTGKSQFLFNLLKNKKFEFKEKSFNLNANTININIFELVDIVMKDLSVFKKRLSDIHENTKLPIVLIIEDIETIVNEQGVESDGVTQALTTFFEGVGSLPVTVIASTNYPERLPNRLIRPKRLENIIKFDIPLPEEVIINTMQVHIEKNIIESLSVSGIKIEDFILRYKNSFSNFTTSHIADFISKIKDHYEFKKEFNSGYILSFDDMDNIKSKMLIPTGDIRNRQDNINKWYEKMTIKGTKPIGFDPSSIKK